LVSSPSLALDISMSPGLEAFNARFACLFSLRLFLCCKYASIPPSSSFQQRLCGSQKPFCAAHLQSAVFISTSQWAFFSIRVLSLSMEMQVVSSEFLHAHIFGLFTIVFFNPNVTSERTFTLPFSHGDRDGASRSAKNQRKFPNLVAAGAAPQQPQWLQPDGASRSVCGGVSLAESLTDGGNRDRLQCRARIDRSSAHRAAAPAGWPGPPTVTGTARHHTVTQGGTVTAPCK
jgi:hypothetical protein